MSNIYREIGVDYDVLDAGKRMAIATALTTSSFALPRGAEAVDSSRGEPAFVMKFGDTHFAMVLECLGTKSTLAKEVENGIGVNHFDWIGFDSVAAIVNDLCSTGALPLAVNAYFATGSPGFYSAPERFASLVQGWRAACEESGAIWGGGESPMLNGIIADNEIELAGCAVGFVPQGFDPLTGDRIAAGDQIVLVASSGLHTNGSSLARAAAAAAGGYDVTLSDGSRIGDALLTPSVLYVKLLEALYATGTKLSYASIVTGHGLRKVMRANRSFTYRITQLLPVPLSLQFIADVLELDLRQAYETLNMGVGIALFCRADDSDEIIRIATDLGYMAIVGGVVEPGPRRVVIEPIDVTFSDEDLRLR